MPVVEWYNVLASNEVAMPVVEWYNVLASNEGAMPAVACQTYRHPVAIYVISSLFFLPTRHQFDACFVIGQDVGEAVLSSVHWQ